MNSMNSRTMEILPVEDNPGDARLTREAFNEGRLLNNLTVVADGVEALALRTVSGPDLLPASISAEVASQQRIQIGPVFRLALTQDHPKLYLWWQREYRRLRVIRDLPRD